MSGHANLVKRAAIAALVVGLATPVAASAATATSPLSPSRTAVLHVSEQDGNKTFHVSPGTRIAVRLHGSYDPPTADHPEVLQAGAHNGGYPSKSDANASFTAISTGSATISSRLDADCMHPQPGHMRCMMMTAPLQINIVVDGPTSLGAVRDPAALFGGGFLAALPVWATRQ